ncbi:MAG TPA: hypothetical protein VN181_07270, partial [Thermoanaerobaculia bacterium]|nr:hypothetical protein [Thermoanaerobaculia bacterium]
MLAFLLFASLHCRNAESVQRDPLETEAEDLFVGYLRIDTTNPPGNESAGAKHLQQFLTKNGIASQLVGDDPKR